MPAIKKSASSMKAKGRSVLDDPKAGAYEYWAGREKGKEKRGSPTGSKKASKKTPMKKSRLKTEITTEDKAPSFAKGGGKAEIDELTLQNNQLREQLQEATNREQIISFKVQQMYMQSQAMVFNLNQRLRQLFMTNAPEVYKTMESSEFPQLPTLESFMATSPTTPQQMSLM